MWNILPLEIQEQILCTNIEILIISQVLNTDIRKLTNNKFIKLDRNLLMTKFTRSMQEFKAHKDLIVIHIPASIYDIKSEKCLSNNCYLITFNEYLRIIDKDYGRVSYVYSRNTKNQIYIHPCKMVVKKTGGRHEDFILTKDQSLKDICDSTVYIEVNFTLAFVLTDLTD